MFAFDLIFKLLCLFVLSKDMIIKSSETEGCIFVTIICICHIMYIPLSTKYYLQSIITVNLYCFPRVGVGKKVWIIHTAG